MNYLEMKNISLIRDEIKILNNINLKIDKGDFLSVIGSSGSGKSTLLRLLGNLITESSGEILFKCKNYKDYDSTYLRQTVHYSHQNPYLFGETVKDNLIFPFEMRNKDVDYEKIVDYLNKFNLNESFLDKNIKKLSGGEIQRIAFIRSLLIEPKVILLDEISSALDEVNKKNLSNVLKELNEKGLTIISISHDLNQAYSDGNKLIKLHRGEIIERVNL